MGIGLKKKVSSVRIECAIGQNIYVKEMNTPPGTAECSMLGGTTAREAYARKNSMPEASIGGEGATG
jgi:hypothetical protein